MWEEENKNESSRAQIKSKKYVCDTNGDDTNSAF
jgi:hypothetical protein